MSFEPTSETFSNLFILLSMRRSLQLYYLKYFFFKTTIRECSFMQPNTTYFFIKIRNITCAPTKTQILQSNWYIFITLISLTAPHPISRVCFKKSPSRLSTGGNLLYGSLGSRVCNDLFYLS